MGADEFEIPVGARKASVSVCGGRPSMITPPHSGSNAVERDNISEMLKR
jgi:hypothetical protein